MRISSASVVLLCAFTVGCGPSGPKRGFVEGVVTLDGKPLSNAQVSFTPESGRPSIGMTDDDGEYYLRMTRHLDGALIGEHNVRILTEQGYAPSGGQVRKVPRIYNYETTLTATVEEGDNEFNWDLTTPDEGPTQSE